MDRWIDNDFEINKKIQLFFACVYKWIERMDSGNGGCVVATVYVHLIHITH